jgi:glutamyl-tRNA synthetase
MAERTQFYLVDEVEFEPKAAKKHLKPEAHEPLSALRDALEKTKGWTAASLEPVFDSLCVAHDVKMGQLAQPTRVAITGSSASPGIFETLEVLGRERSLARLDRALARIKAQS